MEKCCLRCCSEEEKLTDPGCLENVVNGWVNWTLTCQLLRRQYTRTADFCHSRYMTTLFESLRDDTYNFSDPAREFTVFVANNDAFSYLPWPSIDMLMRELDRTRMVTSSSRNSLVVFVSYLSSSISKLICRCYCCCLIIILSASSWLSLLNSFSFSTLI